MAGPIAGSEPGAGVATAGPSAPLLGFRAFVATGRAARPRRGPEEVESRAPSTRAVKARARFGAILLGCSSPPAGGTGAVASASSPPPARSGASAAGTTWDPGSRRAERCGESDAPAAGSADPCVAEPLDTRLLVTTVGSPQGAAAAAAAGTGSAAGTGFAAAGGGRTSPSFAARTETSVPASVMTATSAGSDAATVAVWGFALAEAVSKSESWEFGCVGMPAASGRHAAREARSVRHASAPQGCRALSVRCLRPRPAVVPTHPSNDCADRLSGGSPRLHHAEAKPTSVRPAIRARVASRSSRWTLTRQPADPIVGEPLVAVHGQRRPARRPRATRQPRTLSQRPVR